MLPADWVWTAWLEVGGLPWVSAPDRRTRRRPAHRRRADNATAPTTSAPVPAALVAVAGDARSHFAAAVAVFDGDPDEPSTDAVTLRVGVRAGNDVVVAALDALVADGTANEHAGRIHAGSRIGREAWRPVRRSTRRLGELLNASQLQTLATSSDAHPNANAADVPDTVAALIPCGPGPHRRRARPAQCCGSGLRARRHRHLRRDLLRRTRRVRTGRQPASHRDAQWVDNTLDAGCR
jgi:hypothetical protein